MKTEDQPLTSHQAIFLAGPTAVGKSQVALALAERLNGEIISVDSMQVYHGLNIGTAKPSPSEQDKVRHHLINVIDLNQSYDAARFVKDAKVAVTDIRHRNATPIFCGGTGLYFKAYLHGLGQTPPSDPTLRSELEQLPLDVLLEELSSKDPDTFQRIDRNNPRRIIRALEIIRLTGQPVSPQRANWSSASTPEKTLVHALRRPTEDLADRINLRVDQMFELGLVEETKSLMKQGLTDNPTAMQAIGYRQVVEYLAGERSLQETIELIKLKTRQFARRQLTWFRNQLPCTWHDLTPTLSPQTIANRILP